MKLLRKAHFSHIQRTLTHVVNLDLSLSFSLEGLFLKTGLRSWLNQTIEHNRSDQMAGCIFNKTGALFLGFHSFKCFLAFQIHISPICSIRVYKTW